MTIGFGLGSSTLMQSILYAIKPKILYCLPLTQKQQKVRSSPYAPNSLLPAMLVLSATNTDIHIGCIHKCFVGVTGEFQLVCRCVSTYLSAYVFMFRVTVYVRYCM